MGLSVNVKDKEDMLQFCKMIFMAVKEAENGPLGGLPEGHLYAHVMGVLNLDELQGILGVMKRANLIESRGYLLTIKEKKGPLQ